MLLDSDGATHLSTTLKDLQKLNIDAVGVMGDGLTVDLGAGGLNDFANLGAGGLPSFTDSADITLALNDAGQVDLSNLTTLTAGLDNLATAGIDQISVEGLGVDALGEFDIFALESALNTANINGGPALGLQISDAQANVLADNVLPDGTMAFADDATQVLVDAGEGTHLSTTLKDLQKLNIDAVGVMGDGLTVDLGGDLAICDLQFGR